MGDIDRQRVALKEGSASSGAKALGKRCPRANSLPRLTPCMPS